jgi:hypothetical protein
MPLGARPISVVLLVYREQSRDQNHEISSSGDFGFFTENQGPSAYGRQYARDAKFVYYYGRRVQGARPETFRRLRNDRLTWGASESDYYVGDQAVGADPSCLQVFHLPGLGHGEYVRDTGASLALSPLVRRGESDPAREVGVGASRRHNAAGVPGASKARFSGTP